MRALARALRQYRACSRSQRGSRVYHPDGSSKNHHQVLIPSRRGSAYYLSNSYPRIKEFRTLSTAAADDSPQAAAGYDGKAGPLHEYERRISSGELVDGDSFQMHKGVADPLEVVAGEISDESILLCVDEFMVNDVADALILNRLFGHLFSKGVVLVSTSNRAPDNLYEGGLQRDLFLPFIATLKDRCIAHAIGSSTDYRKMTNAEQGFYLVGHEYSGLLKQKFQQLIGEGTPFPQVVEVVMGRQLQVPLGANGCAYFPFEELCDRPLGAADYFGLFKKFHTLALESVPKFGVHNRTAAYRFVTLVDVMYENKSRLLCTAETPPVELFERIVTIADAEKISPRTSSRSLKKDDLDLCVDNELGFAKDRTISRLTEMNSREYLEQHEASLQEMACNSL
ncbi:uncharacterized protein A4U43_C01F300 [Asparagus officinalis]|uniref:Lactation elevated protein 1 n=1 Tax=Asparagus officinalis TaxID=4686 RepID=A0A5P1FKW0_ASPOF|nr:uncharacterized protein A4U43_C01F300 [Asparagus officinalis]